MNNNIFNGLSDQEKTLATAAKPYIEATQTAIERVSGKQDGSWVAATLPADDAAIETAKNNLQHAVASSLNIDLDLQSKSTPLEQLLATQNWKQEEQFRRAYQSAIDNADEIWGNGNVVSLNSRAHR